MGIQFAATKYVADNGEGQVITPRGYSTVKFPYADEKNDAWEMHSRRQPDGYVVENPLIDDRSGLIWPAVNGLALVQLEHEWAAGTHTAIGVHVVTDPLGQLRRQGEDLRPTVTGMDYAGVYTLWTPVTAGAPIALQVAHNGDVDALLVRAQLSVVIFYDLVDEPTLQRPRIRRGTNPEQQGPRE